MAITFIFKYVIPMQVLHAMEAPSEPEPEGEGEGESSQEPPRQLEAWPEPKPEPSIKSIKSELDYWREQAKNYTDAKAAFYKPEYAWSEEERSSAEEVHAMGEFTPELMDLALKDIQNNIDSSRVELAKTVPKFSDTPSRSGNSSTNPPSERT